MAETADVYESDEVEFVGFRLSWGGIVAGFVVAMVVQILLSLLGLAIGFGSLNFGGGEPFQGMGVGAGIWAVVTSLISLFLGGLAAGHLAGTLTRFDGILHGVLVWGLTTIVTLWALAAGLGTVVGGAFGLAGETISAAVGGAAHVGAAAVSGTAEGGDAMARDSSAHEQVVATLTRRGLTRQQAEAAASEIRQARQQFQLQAERVRRRAPEVASNIASTLSTAAWWALVAGVISLIAAAWGAALTAED